MQLKNQYIKIRRANENNLKNISLDIPVNKFTVVTGVSGSGKSSLVFDTIAKESQARYLESFSLRARQFIGKTGHADIESIEGLSPAIIVSQKTVVKNSRSTVGTLTELNDLLRLLFARLGKSPENIKLSRSMFSFNTQEGACPNCKGLGLEEQIDPELLISDKNKSLREGALTITTPSGYIIYSQVTMDVMQQVCESEGFSVDIPWKDLSEEQKHIVWFGSDKIKIPFGKHTLESRMKWSGITAKPREEGYYKGIIPIMDNILKRDRNKNILRFVSSKTCSKCIGKRLNEKALSVKFDNKSIADFIEMPISDLHHYFKNYREDENPVFAQISNEIVGKCKILNSLGLDYLSLDRNSETLSAGEAQRIRLAMQLDNDLTGLTYILDEPSVGLHPVNSAKMIEVLKKLKELGNTVIVVEHDEQFMKAADHIIDIGPKAGMNGGNVLFNITSEEINKIDCSESETLKFLQNKIDDSFRLSAPILKSIIQFKGIKKHNINGIDISLKVSAMNVVSGVSGAGKSTLVHHVIKPLIKNVLNKNFELSGIADSISEFDSIEKIVEVDQSPIGKTTRSNPATYTKLFDLIRDLFSKLEESKKRNYSKSRFSFNTKGGRCESCEGGGYRQIKLHHLQNVEVLCEKCNGKRFDDETLEIKYNGKNIAEILEMTVDEACIFFKKEKKILVYLDALQNLGLGYLHLGQRSSTLSGGEAQRVKLAAELSQKSRLKTLYILDEPSTGLHSSDVKVLLKFFNEIIKNGNTILLIEHNPDIIQKAHHIIDLGPESGTNGGKLVFQGKPEELKYNSDSLTAKALQHKDDLIIRNSDTKNQYEPKQENIVLKGVKTNNLKNIDIEIPKNKITTVTGVSGSGKSSLIFNTIYSHCIQSFTKAYSSYLRSMIDTGKSAYFDSGKGLMPAIAIRQNQSQTSSVRSTVGTLSGVYDLYRLLFSRFSKNEKNENCHLPASAFSFNNETGACLNCGGIGTIKKANPDRIITNPELSIKDGAMSGTKSGKFYGDIFGQHIAILNAVEKFFKYDLSKPFQDLSEEEKMHVLFGTDEKEYDCSWEYKRKNRSGTQNFKSKWKGFSWYFEDEYNRKLENNKVGSFISLMKDVDCPVCKNTRLKPDLQQWKISNYSISELCNLSIDKSIDFFEKTYFSEYEIVAFKEVSEKILKKLYASKKLGLSYLSVSRKTESLSGGEFQRLRLASAIDLGLSRMLYILDEPSIGLHPKDTDNLISVLNEIKHKDNTIIIAEHDSMIISKSDHIIELGPGAGEEGGEIIYQAIANQYPFYKIISDEPQKEIDITNSPFIQIKNAGLNNLKIPQATIPLNCIVAFCGVSGSGKSSLAINTIGKSLQTQRLIACDKIDGGEQISNIEIVDTKAITGNASGTLLSSLNIFDDIKRLFAKTEEAKAGKFKISDFSYTTGKHRCQECNGNGEIQIGMDFLPDIIQTCNKCKGLRYDDKILSCKYKNLSIADILEITSEKAIDIFNDERNIFSTLVLLKENGLNHLQFGRKLNTLSGGELQRLKLVKHIISGKSKNTLFIFDEPSKGLSYKDVQLLYKVLRKLVDNGNSVWIIEHNTQLISLSDWIIELGEGSGNNGGRIIAESSPKNLLKNKNSIIASYL